MSVEGQRPSARLIGARMVACLALLFLEATVNMIVQRRLPTWALAISLPFLFCLSVFQTWALITWPVLHISLWEFLRTMPAGWRELRRRH